jgi:hypothetical protein
MNRRIVNFVLLFALAAGAAVSAAIGAEAKARTLEGTLVDTKCYFADPANKGNDHGPMKACGTACAKGGSPVGILTEDGKHYALVVPAPSVADHVGQTVRATGAVREGSFVPSKLEVKTASGWQEVKLGGGMM